MTPVLANLDKLDSAHAYFERTGNDRHADALCKQSPDHSDVFLVKLRSAVHRSPSLSMFDIVRRILFWSAIGKVLNPIVPTLAIKVADNVIVWSWAMPKPSDDYMDRDTLLYFILRTFRHRYLAIRACTVNLSQKPCTVSLHRACSTKIAYLNYAFPTRNVFPLFGGIHG